MIDMQFWNEGEEKERLNLSVGVGFGWRGFYCGVDFDLFDCVFVCFYLFALHCSRDGPR